MTGHKLFVIVAALLSAAHTACVMVQPLGFSVGLFSYLITSAREACNFHVRKLFI